MSDNVNPAGTANTVSAHEITATSQKTTLKSNLIYLPSSNSSLIALL